MAIPSALKMQIMISILVIVLHNFVVLGGTQIAILLTSMVYFSVGCMIVTQMESIGSHAQKPSAFRTPPLLRISQAKEAIIILLRAQ